MTALEKLRSIPAASLTEFIRRKQQCESAGSATKQTSSAICGTLAESILAGSPISRDDAAKAETTLELFNRFEAVALHHSQGKSRIFIEHEPFRLTIERSTRGGVATKLFP